MPVFLACVFLLLHVQICFNCKKNSLKIRQANMQVFSVAIEETTSTGTFLATLRFHTKLIRQLIFLIITGSKL